jgi:hypothetical protein
MQYLMEDWLAFKETHSLRLLVDLPWPRNAQCATILRAFEEQWGYLREAALYFSGMRRRGIQHVP